MMQAGMAPPADALGEAQPDGEAPQTAEPSDQRFAVLQYQLTAADYAPYLSATKRHRRRARGTLASAAFAALMALNFLSGKLPVPDNPFGQALEILLILGIPIGAALWKLRHDLSAESREVLPTPVDVTVDIYSDRAVEHRADHAAPVTYRARSAHDISLTRRGVVLDADHAALVIPARAFADKASMVELVRHWSAQRR